MLLLASATLLDWDLVISPLSLVELFLWQERQLVKKSRPIRALGPSGAPVTETCRRRKDPAAVLPESPWSLDDLLALERDTALNASDLLLLVVIQRPRSSYIGACHTFLCIKNWFFPEEEKQSSRNHTHTLFSSQ